MKYLGAKISEKDLDKKIEPLFDLKIKKKMNDNFKEYSY